MYLKRLTKFTFLLFIVILTLNSSCPPTEDIEDATEHIENGLREAARGMAQLDPIGLKQLLEENAELRAIVNRLYGATGTLVPITSKVIIKAVLRSGSCKSLDIYINDEIDHNLHNLKEFNIEDWGDFWHYAQNFKDDCKAGEYGTGDPYICFNAAITPEQLYACYHDFPSVTCCSPIGLSNRWWKHGRKDICPSVCPASK